jgi:hypothetical protein
LPNSEDNEKSLGLHYQIKILVGIYKSNYLYTAPEALFSVQKRPNFGKSEGFNDQTLSPELRAEMKGCVTEVCR